MKNVIQAKAKEKQQGGQGGILLSQKSDEANGMRTDEELSKLAGFNLGGLYLAAENSAVSFSHAGRKRQQKSRGRKPSA